MENNRKNTIKKVLIISWHYLPSNAMAAQRVKGFVKYLPEFGCQPLVLTRASISKDKLMEDSQNIFRTEDSNIENLVRNKCKRTTKKIEKKQSKTLSLSSIFKYIKGIVFLLAKRFNKYIVPIFNIWEWEWYFKACKLGLEILANEKIDIIITTSPPEIVHLVGAFLKRKTGIKWIADYRDLWTKNPYYSQTIIYKKLEEILERKIINKADKTLTTTSSFSKILEEQFMKKTTVVMNGFDSRNFTEIQTIKLTKHFTITHTGSIYQGTRDPSMLFECLSDFVKEGIIKENEIKVRFYGQNLSPLYSLINKYALDNMVTIERNIPHEEAIKKQKESQLLLLLQWLREEEKAFCPGKLFEYIATGRPIIAIAPRNGEVARIIEKDNFGCICETKNCLKDKLYNFIIEFREKGSIKKWTTDKAIKKHSHQIMAKNLRKILNEL